MILAVGLAEFCANRMIVGESNMRDETSVKSSHWAETVHPVIAAARDTMDKPSDGSEKRMLEVLHQFASPTSMVDFGCGLGRFLHLSKSMGVTEVLGLDIPEVDVKDRLIAKQEFMPADFRNPISLDKRYDLALSVEVAEHLPLESAEVFVDSLTKASDLVMFGAAVPYQGGMGHVNENWLEFWSLLFAAKDYSAFDVFRPALWRDPSVKYFYKQNTILYATGKAREALIDSGVAPSDEINTYIHPDMYVKAVHRTLPPSLRTVYQDVSDYYSRLKLGSSYVQKRVFGQERLNFSELFTSNGEAKKDGLGDKLFGSLFTKK